MSVWDPEETNAILSLIPSLDTWKDDSWRPEPEILLSARSAQPLRRELRCSQEGLIVRQLYSALRLTDSLICDFRLEHKLQQALVLQHYIPEAIPATRGLSREMQRVGPAGLRYSLSRIFQGGFYIKPTLGYAHRANGKPDPTEDLLKALEVPDSNLKRPAPNALIDEPFIVQERLAIHSEYRVHTVGGDVVDDLTFKVGNGVIPIPGERDEANEFVKRLLNRLPPSLTRRTLCGWDVACTMDGRYLVVEVNYSGIHPVFEPGFQCSSYFLAPGWCANAVARLIRHVEKVYRTKIIVQADAATDSPDGRFDNHVYAWVSRWQNLLAIVDEMDGLLAGAEASVPGSSLMDSVPEWKRSFLRPLLQVRDVGRKADLIDESRSRSQLRL